MLIEFYTLKDGKFDYKTVDSDSIVQFDIVNIPITRKDGEFKRFNKRGVLQLSSGERFPCVMAVINHCKEIFTYELIEKRPVSVWKRVGSRFSHNMRERKAVNWDYKVTGKKENNEVTA